MADRRPYTQRDIERAIKAAEKAGKEVVRVRFVGTGFELVTSRPGADVVELERNEWDED